MNLLHSLVLPERFFLTLQCVEHPAAMLPVRPRDGVGATRSTGAGSRFTGDPLFGAGPAPHTVTGGADDTLQFFGLTLGTFHFHLLRVPHAKKFKKIIAF
jgi:hypothetical protein